MTYKTHLDKKLLAEFIQRKLKCEAQVKICHETSEDGYEHTHCAVLSPKKPNIRDARAFDFNDIHPNIKVPASNEHFKNQVKYIEKQDQDYYGEIDVPDSKEEKFEKVLEFVKSCQTWQQVLRGPTEMLIVISGKLPFFQQVFNNLACVRTETTEYHLKDFTLPALDLTRPTLLWGVSNAGKTQFALAHFSKPLFVCNVDDLNKFQEGYHDGIVFDDIDFSQWPPTALLHLVDIANTRTIKCRYVNAMIPKGTPRIFTSNVPWALENVHMTDEQKNALYRHDRLYKVQVTTPLFGPNNIKGRDCIGDNAGLQEEEVRQDRAGQAGQEEDVLERN